MKTEWMKRMMMFLSVLGGILALAALTSMHMANQACLIGQIEVRYPIFLPFNLFFFGVWGFFFFIVARIIHKMHVGNLGWYQRLLFHVPFGLLICWIHLLLVYGAIQTNLIATQMMMGHQHGFRGFFFQWVYSDLYIYLAMSVLIHLGLIYRQNREKDLQTSQLETELAQSQLQALKMQLHPHFLFNALNTISAYVYKDQKIAVKMIARLSDLLRLTLDIKNDYGIPLAAEIEIVRKYLEIETMRFGDRLRVEFNLAPETLEYKVPVLILQPLVENAIRHGIAPKIDGGTIRISSQVGSEGMTITIADDGVGFCAESFKQEESQGIGIGNVRERLRKMYGDRAGLTIHSTPTQGCQITLTFPSSLDPHFFNREGGQ